MSKKQSHTRIIIFTLLSLLFSFILIIGSLTAIRKAYHHTLNIVQNEANREKSKNITQYKITITSQTTLDDIATELKNISFITDKTYFKLEAKLAHMDDGFVPGTYSLSSNMKSEEILELLTSDPQNAEQTVQFTIPEGFTIEQIAERLDKEEIISKADFLAAVQGNDYSANYEFLQAIPNGNYRYTLEGYLFPDTYTIRKGATAQEIIVKMLDRFDDIISDYTSYIEGSPYDLHELLTIASIIEQEVKLSDERTTVSGVIYNRLKEGMNLQMCSTVQYALGGRKAALTNEDLTIESPYNTYLHSGLPIGPICNPGKESIAAAMMPESNNYYYFVLEDVETGKHCFSSTYNEHLNAKSQYKQNNDKNFTE